jgi:Tfp pilus assembly protein PilO
MTRASLNGKPEDLDINQVAAQSIQDSFKKVSESSANDELKNQLIKLNEAVAEMLKVLSPAQQKQVASDLKVLTD